MASEQTSPAGPAGSTHLFTEAWESEGRGSGVSSGFLRDMHGSISGYIICYFLGGKQEGEERLSQHPLVHISCQTPS